MTELVEHVVLVTRDHGDPETVTIAGSAVVGRSGSIPVASPVVAEQHVRLDSTPTGLVVTDLAQRGDVYTNGLAVQGPQIIGVGDVLVLPGGTKVAVLSAPHTVAPPPSSSPTPPTSEPAPRRARRSTVVAIGAVALAIVMVVVAVTVVLTRRGSQVDLTAPATDFDGQAQQLDLLLNGTLQAASNAAATTAQPTLLDRGVSGCGAAGPANTAMTSLVRTGLVAVPESRRQQVYDAVLQHWRTEPSVRSLAGGVDDQSGHPADWFPVQAVYAEPASSAHFAISTTVKKRSQYQMDIPGDGDAIVEVLVGGPCSSLPKEGAPPETPTTIPGRCSGLDRVSYCLENPPPDENASQPGQGPTTCADPQSPTCRPQTSTTETTPRPNQRPSTTAPAPGSPVVRLDNLGVGSAKFGMLTDQVLPMLQSTLGTPDEDWRLAAPCSATITLRYLRWGQLTLAFSLDTAQTPPTSPFEFVGYTYGPPPESGSATPAVTTPDGIALGTPVSELLTRQPVSINTSSAYPDGAAFQAGHTAGSVTGTAPDDTVRTIDAGKSGIAEPGACD